MDAFVLIFHGEYASIMDPKQLSNFTVRFPSPRCPHESKFFDEGTSMESVVWRQRFQESEF